MVRSRLGRYRCGVCGKFVNLNVGCSCGETKFFILENEDLWLTRERLGIPPRRLRPKGRR